MMLGIKEPAAAFGQSIIIVCKWIRRLASNSFFLWLFACSYTAIVFRHTFIFPPIFEDYYITSRLGQIELNEILSYYVQGRSVFGVFYRPTGDLLQWILLKLFGHNGVTQHMVQFGITCLASALIFRLTFLLSKSYSVSFWSCIWFMASGVQSLYYLTGNTYIFDRLALVFTLAAIVLSISRYWMLSPLCLLAALTTKETAVVFPGLLVIFWLGMYCVYRSSLAQKQRIMIRSGVSLAVIYCGYCAMRYYTKGAFAPIKQGYMLTTDPAVISRNAMYYAAYLAEPIFWWFYKSGSLDTAPVDEPHGVWALLAAIPVLLMAISIICGTVFRKQSVRTGAALLFLGCGFLIVSISPFLLIVHQSRILYYLVYFSSVGASVIFGCFTVWLLRLFILKSGCVRIVCHALALLLLSLYISHWQPHVVYAKSWYRAHLELGTGAVPDLIQNTRERVQDISAKTVAIVGTTYAQQKAVYFEYLFDEHFERPVSLNFYSSLPSLREGYLNISDSIDLLTYVPLTDRFAMLLNQQVIAGQGITNGNFKADADQLGKWRPWGWVPAAQRSGFTMEKYGEAQAGVKLPSVQPGMHEGLKQACLLVPGKYQATFTCSAGEGAVPTLDIRQEIPMDVLGRHVITDWATPGIKTVTFDVNTTGPYSLVFGSSGTKEGWLTVSNVNLQWISNETMPDKPLIHQKNLLPSMTEFNALILETTGTYLMLDDSTTATSGWPMVRVDSEFTEEMTKYSISVAGKGVASDFVEVMVTPEYDDPEGYQSDDMFVLHLPLDDEWTTSARSFSLHPWCRKIRVDFGPILFDNAQAATGSVLLRSLGLHQQSLPVYKY